MGLVSPLGRIVLWDEWVAAQKSRRAEDGLVVAAGTPLVPGREGRQTKEVMRDDRLKEEVFG